MIPSAPVFALDLEVYRNYFLAGFKSIDGLTLLQFEAPLNPSKILSLLENNRIVTFNGVAYDIPVLSLALTGVSTEFLKSVSDDIILNRLKAWQVREKYGGVDLSFVDHVDTMPISFGHAGLKMYAARMHNEDLEELPFDPAAVISPFDAIKLKSYNEKDLDKTLRLYKNVIEAVELRSDLSAAYGINVMCKSDAQISESVFRKLIGRKIPLQDSQSYRSWFYKAPGKVHFQTKGLRQVKDQIESLRFSLSCGVISPPEELSNLVVSVGHATYSMGMGGLHSREKSCAYHSNGSMVLLDRDVRSYYPELILTTGIYPPQIGPEFLTIFHPIVDRRLNAKADPARAKEAGTLKIVINGTFGKMGDPYSILFFPEGLVFVTLTGQLYLLMLIEALELSGIRVISANTDGILIYTEKRELANSIVSDWESWTGLVTEESTYVSIYSKDVNNYIGIKENGSLKTKGLYTQGGLAKNPVNTICTDAVINYLSKRIPIEETINKCSDITKFVTVRQVKERACFQGQPLGHIVRWYHSFSGSPIVGEKTGNQIPDSESTTPLLVINHKDSIPCDLDYGWYAKKSYKMLSDVGATL